MRSRAPWISLALALIGLGAAQELFKAPARGKPVAARHPQRARVAARRAQPALATRPAGRLAPRAAVGNWGHGSWCWFGDPRAVRVKGQYDQTFAGWIDWNGNIRIGAYDARFGLVGTRVLGRVFHDDHGAPAIFVEPDRRLTVFWSGHDGPTMFYRSTLRPEDISAWGPVQQLRSRIKGQLGFTYPNPVLLPADGNKLFLFWRGADWSADYATRTLSGRWSGARELIRNPGERPYLKVAADGGNTVGFAFTNGHPRNLLTSIYFAAYRAGSLWTAAGRRIRRLSNGPIYPREAQKVYDARKSSTSAWVWDIAFAADGRPVILYATFPRGGNHQYWYARWSGSRWVSHFITFGGPTISPGTIEYQYSGGMTLDHSNPSVVYLSKRVHGWFQIERWTTGDGGVRWRHRAVVRTPGADNVRPVVARGSAGGPASLLWLHGRYGSYTHYQTSVDYVR